MIERLKKNKIFRRCLVWCMYLLSPVNALIPKNSKRILLFDSGRDYLDDNTEAFYTWLKNNDFEKKYKIVCCVPRQKGRLPYKDYQPVGSIKGLWYYLTTKYVVFSFGDFRIKPSNKQVVVNQWHGTPMKKIGKLTNYDSYTKEKLDNFTYIIASSETFVDVLVEAFGCSKEKVKVLGNARNDYLFDKIDVLPTLGIKEIYKKKVLWMPTFRTSNDDRFHDGALVESETLLPILDTYDKLNSLDEYLKTKNTLLVIKVHPLAKFKKNSLSNIKIMTNDDIVPKGVKLYQFIKEFDALITDYSSVYCDYLLLDRPIGFTLDDYQIYANNRGFVFEDIIKYMPGCYLYTDCDFKKFINEIISETDSSKDLRHSLVDFYNKHQDNNNCQRLADLMGLV